MHNFNWDDIRHFLAAARGGSLSAASRLLGGNQPTVGRRIDALEGALGVRLFQRHPKGLTLTDEGRYILHIAESMEEAALAMGRGWQGGTEIQGTVKLAVPEGLASHVIAPGLPLFLERYPRLDVVLLPSSASADLIHGEAEIAVRLFRPIEGDISARKVGEMEFGLYASRSYFASRGTPRNERELARHCFIGYGERLRQADESRWLEKTAKAERFAFRSDDTHARLAATIAGLGLAVLPCFLAERSGLRPAAIAAAIPPRPIWLAVHRDLRNLARVRVTVDWLGSLLQETFPKRPSDAVGKTTRNCPQRPMSESS